LHVPNRPRGGCVDHGLSSTCSLLCLCLFDIGTGRAGMDGMDGANRCPDGNAWKAGFGRASRCSFFACYCREGDGIMSSCLPSSPSRGNEPLSSIVDRLADGRLAGWPGSGHTWERASRGDDDEELSMDGQSVGKTPCSKRHRGGGSSLRWFVPRRPGSGWLDLTRLELISSPWLVNGLDGLASSCGRVLGCRPLFQQ
jgi:hypothetical protein